jgi:hypothetical protein
MRAFGIPIVPLGGLTSVSAQTSGAPPARRPLGRREAPSPARTPIFSSSMCCFTGPRWRAGKVGRLGDPSLPLIFDGRCRAHHAFGATSSFQWVGSARSPRRRLRAGGRSGPKPQARSAVSGADDDLFEFDVLFDRAALARGESRTTRRSSLQQIFRWALPRQPREGGNGRLGRL